MILGENHMSQKERLQHKRSKLEQHWDELSRKVDVLGNSLLTETRVEEKLRLETHLTEAETEREKIEKKLDDVEKRLETLQHGHVDEEAASDLPKLTEETAARDIHEKPRSDEMTNGLAIAATAVTLLSAFFTKTAQKTDEQSAEALLGLIKNKFEKDRDVYAEKTLAQFQKKPQGYQEPLIDILTEKVKEDPVFGETLRRMGSELEDELPPGSISQIATGSGIAQAAGSGSSASVVMSSGDKE